MIEEAYPARSLLVFDPRNQNAHGIVGYDPTTKVFRLIATRGRKHRKQNGNIMLPIIYDHTTDELEMMLAWAEAGGMQIIYEWGKETRQPIKVFEAYDKNLEAIRAETEAIINRLADKYKGLKEGHHRY